MEVITIESQAFKDLMSKVDTIFDYVISQQNTQDEEDSWVDSYEVCTFLKISDRTLQRLRSENKRMMEENLIRRSEDCLKDLIQNHQKNVRQKQSAQLHP